ncbi:hypothetical protein SAMN04487983_100316 [Streptomyces sp. yr375]|nr:hypothetical protein SAMN04487983_100316 [Streptomyces sp. yr375]
MAQGERRVSRGLRGRGRAAHAAVYPGRRTAQVCQLRDGVSAPGSVGGGRAAGPAVHPVWRTAQVCQPRDGVSAPGSVGGGRAARAAVYPGRWAGQVAAGARWGLEAAHLVLVRELLHLGPVRGPAARDEP